MQLHMKRMFFILGFEKNLIFEKNYVYIAYKTIHIEVCADQQICPICASFEDNAQYNSTLTL